MDDFQFEDVFTLNIQKCAEDKSKPAIIRSVFTELRDHNYISVGKFFEDMSEADLSILVEMSDRIHALDGQEPEAPEDNDAYESLTLLSIGLAVGGGALVTEDVAADAFNATMVLISLEAMARKNIIIAHRENWTVDLNDDTGIVASPRGDLDYGSM